MEISEEIPPSSAHNDDLTIISSVLPSRMKDGSDGGAAEQKNTDERCLVCGDRQARMHYGVLTCFGCKGFFRRTLKRSTQYKCRQHGSCPVDKYERNSCRFCRFKRCLEVGMDPKAVRPDRDSTGRHYLRRTRRLKFANGADEAPVDNVEVMEEWTRRLPVDMRTILMRLMNVDVMVNAGNTLSNATEIYPLRCGSLEDFLCDPKLLNEKKTEIRYEPYRKIEMDELLAITHRNLLALIDWTHHLCDSMERITVHDKFLIVLNSFTPLTIFSAAAGTAKWTEDKNILCLCKLGCVPRNAQQIYTDLYQLSNGLINRILDELVDPLRSLKLTDEEVVLMKAIIILNPRLCGLSRYAVAQIGDLRDRIQEVLYQVVRETHPATSPSSRFGNLLLHFSTITILGNVMFENLRTICHNASLKKTAPPDPILYDLIMNDGGAMQQRYTHASLSAASGLDSTDGYHGFMSSSYSNSSVSSLTSGASMSEFEQSSDTTPDDSNLSFSPYYTFLDENLQRSTTGALQDQQQQHQTMMVTADCGVKPSFPGFDATADFEHLTDQTESDPNYNITLTPEMFTGMREALNAAQSMETDTLSTPPNSPRQQQRLTTATTTITTSPPEFHTGSPPAPEPSHGFNY